MVYDFATLSPEDFEELVADLLSKHWHIRLESFKRGRDCGIDLLHTRVLEPKSTTVVQCKRYAPHKYSELLRSMKGERIKVAKLQPERYVLATSVPLSQVNKAELLAVLHPWCRTTSDIFGAEDLNALLRAFPEVEKAHFKLWIGSTAVVERILHARIFNRTHATIAETQEQLSRIVIHPGFDRALEMLAKNHHVLILGNPGIGKTTLARVLLCHYLREGFEPICVSGNIDEAWTLVQNSSSTRKKAVILYDDFLGRFKFDSVRFGKNEELSLLDFLNLVKKQSHLRFILTTREYIFADAHRVHGVFAAGAKEFLSYTLKLAEYSRAHRAMMLFNHLYFSDLPDARLARLVKSKVYHQIVGHTHFSPRIVESISTYANSRTMSDVEYVAYIQREFDNPAQLWDHPFRSDIGHLARRILLTLWSFGGTAELELLKSSVHRTAIAEEVYEFNLSFTEALRQLDGNFLTTDRFPGRSVREGPYYIATFHNPSVEEFVDSLINATPTLLAGMLRAAVCFRQIEKFYEQLKEVEKIGGFSKEDWQVLRERAAAVESVPGGYLMNYQPYGEATRRVWSFDDGDLPRATLVRLEIEAKSSLPDDIQADLLRRVRSDDGWLTLLRGFQNDDSHAYRIQQLHEWIRLESGWSVPMVEACQEAFRRAVFNVVADDDQVWASSISSIRIFAELVCLDGFAWSEYESQIFHSACETVTQTIIDNDRPEDDVRSEARELSKLAKLVNISFKENIGRLESHADDLAETVQDRDANDFEARRASDPSPQAELDIDALFAGLLDG